MSQKRKSAERALAFGLWALAAACGPGGFAKVESPTQRNLRGVHVSSKAEIYVAGEAGTVLFFDGDVVTDTSTDADPGIRVPSFYGIGAGNGRMRVAGDNGLILKKKNDNYEVERSRTNQRFLTVLQATPSIAYVAGEGGTVLRSTAGGGWEGVDSHASGNSKITSGFSTGHSSLMFTTDKGDLIEQVRGEFVVESVITETSTTPLPLFGVWSSSSAEDLYAVALGGRILKRSKADGKWSIETSPARSDLYGIFGSAPDRIFAVGARGTVLRFDGTSWNNIASGTSEDLYAIHGSSDGTQIVAVGSNGTMIQLEQDEPE
jgi:photosystem II stability/assembly factor-like uncharacterized protein